MVCLHSIYKIKNREPQNGQKNRKIIANEWRTSVTTTTWNWIPCQNKNQKEYASSLWTRWRRCISMLCWCSYEPKKKYAINSYPSSKNESLRDPPGFLIIWIDSKFVLPCRKKSMHATFKIRAYDRWRNRRLPPSNLKRGNAAATESQL